MKHHSNRHKISKKKGDQLIEQLKESHRLAVYGNPNIICTSRSTPENEIEEIKPGYLKLVNNSNVLRESLRQTCCIPQTEHLHKITSRMCKLPYISPSYIEVKTLHVSLCDTMQKYHRQITLNTCCLIPQESRIRPEDATRRESNIKN